MTAANPAQVAADYGVNGHINNTTLMNDSFNRCNSMRPTSHKALHMIDATRLAIPYPQRISRIDQCMTSNNLKEMQ